MVDGADGGGERALPEVLRELVATVPALVERLSMERPGRVYRDALEQLERPLLEHVLSLTGGNQLRAARLLGLNRNTLRKRCRALRLASRYRNRRVNTSAATGESD
jgi:two-component system, NtrC family, nitrogen regulation response regulator GlnG